MMMQKRSVVTKDCFKMFGPMALFFVLTVNYATAGEVVCGKTKASNKTLYPINALAIEIARDTGLTTCNRSDRFKDKMKAGKHTGKVILVSKDQISKAKKAILAGSKDFKSTF